MPLFYAVSFAEPDVRAWLTALRWLCDPSQTHTAHITLRGPEQTKLPKKQLEDFNESLRQSRGKVLGAGAFLTSQQHTVYLSCECSAFHSIWHKPARSYNPHMTLYDGGSRSYAEALLQILLSFEIKFEFAPTPLFPILTKTRQVAIPLEAHVPLTTVLRVFQGLGFEDFRQLEDSTRLEYVTRFADYLFARSGSGADDATPKPVLAFGKVKWANG